MKRLISFVLTLSVCVAMSFATFATSPAVVDPLSNTLLGDDSASLLAVCPHAWKHLPWEANSSSGMKRIRASTDIKHLCMFAFVVEPTIIMM